MKKILAGTALSLFLLSGMAFAQTAAIDAQQERLDGLVKELEEAQRVANENARIDQLSREAFEQQSKEISEQESRDNIDRYQQQIDLENTRAERIAIEMQRIEELIEKIKEESEALRQARLDEYNRQIEIERKKIEEIKQRRIAELQAQIDQQQSELETLQAELEDAQNQGTETQE